ncbi:MAG: oxidoreductase, partial [Pseudomonadota bacterium]
MPRPHALIVGTGPGLSASLARKLAADYDLTLTARDIDKLADLAAETGARTVALDGSD